MDRRPVSRRLRGRGPSPSATRLRAHRRVVGAAVAALATLGVAAPLAVAGSSTHVRAVRTATSRATRTRLRHPAARAAATANFDNLGITPGKIKHVWLIILENKSYDATFTGLNNNTYLWQTLPSQGLLLKNYFGTGHFSQDNYIAMTSGQAPISDIQSDCPYYNNMSGTVDKSGSLATNPNYGQFASAAGPNSVQGTNGCVYPNTVPTLFNQFDQAGISWKGYAQDLGNADTARPGKTVDPNHDGGGTSACGAPYAAAGPAPTYANGTATVDVGQPNPGSADPTDQYVPKHFPFPWYQSLLQNPNDCNSSHIANLFDPSNGLFHDLQSEATTPAFSWISPNNCSDAHDATCYGNNLSGGFLSPNTPNPRPQNHTGGLYASDLFLRHVIPEIEASPAFKDGGLIDVTFDEAFPPFTYSGNSFNNSPFDSPTLISSLTSDSAGETVNGKTVYSEPTGPNAPMATDASGNQLYPGPGYNAYVDRPSTCTNPTAPSGTSGTATASTAQECLGGGNHSPGARNDSSASAVAGTSQINDNAVQADDAGRQVTGTGIPSSGTCCFVGDVYTSFTGANGPNGTPAGAQAYKAAFTLVDSSGMPVNVTSNVSGVTMAAETADTDPLYSANYGTPGGGDTGSVLISPYIKPGSSSDVVYNHYSWLRTMEDLFAVGGKSSGLDGMGHIGYAAQPGLDPFGTDVFNNVSKAKAKVVKKHHKKKHAKKRRRRHTTK